MLSKAKIVIALLAGASAILSIIALATTHWMKGCFDTHSFLKLLHNMTSQVYDKESADEDFGGPMSVLEGAWVCFSSGLFDFHLKAANSFTAKMGHNDEASVLRATSALVIISLILSAAGTVACIFGSHLDPRGSNGRNKFVAGMITIAFSAICLFTAVVVFTALMVPATQDEPMLFFDHFEHQVMGLNREKRDIRSVEENLLEIEQAGKVWFDYSYYLAWVSFLLLVGVSIFNCIIFFRRKHSSSPQIAMT